MLKTQITGAKYLSPQTNQMTNLNIAVPADSKDTEFGTSDILLAKDVVAYLNALDSDISNELDAQTDKINKINESIKQFVDHNLIKIVTELPTTDIDKNCIYLVPNKDGEGNNIFIEYIYVEAEGTFEEVGRIQTKVDLSGYYTKEETDNQIQIAKNSAINIHDEDNTKSIKLDINDIEAIEDYGSTVNASLIDHANGGIAIINAVDGFRHINSNGYYSNLYSGGLDIRDETYSTNIYAGQIGMHNSGVDGNIEITTDKDLTQEEQDDGYSPVNIYLTNGDNKATINAKTGFTHKTDDYFVTNLNGYGLDTKDATTGRNLSATNTSIRLNDEKYKAQLCLSSDVDSNYLLIGSDEKFKISRPADNTEGATITGIKSLTAFANPSATKVWATDGSTVDLTTKANVADLATKANASDVLLKKSASGGYYIEENSNKLGEKAFAANRWCTASGGCSFAEGQNTTASGNSSHTEGYNTTASGTSSHAEGEDTIANGSYAHAEGRKTIAANSSHAEGWGTYASGFTAHTEGDNTIASGYCSHAQGCYNVENINAIHSVGIGPSGNRKNAEYIYTKNNQYGSVLVDDPKNGYKYLIGVGGYDGISTDNSTYKSVQEVIADLTSRIEQLETKVRALEAANTPA